MNTPVLASVVGIVALTAAFGAPAFSGDGQVLDDGGAASQAEPDHTFHWDEVAAADAPPRITLDAGADASCAGHVRTHIELAPQESGVKSLTLAPVEGETCVFDVLAIHRTGADAAEYRAQVDAATHDADCCTLTARTDDASGTTTIETSTEDETNQDLAVARYCRLGDGWAHTGYPDPPTVVYTRIYHQMDFCWDDTSAEIESYQGFCFANPSTRWYTDSDECYWSDAEPGPAGTVYLTLHGYFEKQTTHRPSHDMWHTVNGDAGTGRVYCSGDIIGQYDGYASTNNCGAGKPEPESV